MNRYAYKHGSIIVKRKVQSINELAIEINSLTARLQASAYDSELGQLEFNKVNRQLEYLLGDVENQQGIIELFNYSFKGENNRSKVALRSYLKKDIVYYLPKLTKLKLKLKGLI
jgi:hypothetical protein